MERTVHSDLRLIKTPTRTWTRFQMMSYQLMLRKTSLNKIQIAGDDGIVIVPLAERTWLHELSMLQHQTKQPTLLFAVR